MQVGRYQLCGELAQGGMASIYIGHTLGGTRPLAIKRLPETHRANPELVGLFLEEAWLASCVRHENVVETLDVIRAAGDPCLVMDYVEGETSSRLLKTAREHARPVPIPIVAGVIRGALDGLHAVHEAKDENGGALEIVHRDMSPQNVIIGVDGVPRLIDFGVAVASARFHSARVGQLRGKLAYMAPEQLASQPVTRLADVYAAGVVLWEALAGRRLFEAESEGALLRMVMQGVPEAPSASRPEIPKALDDLVMRAVSLRPQDRFPTAQQMAHALELATPSANALDLGEWVRSVAKSSLESRARWVADVLRVPATEKT